MRTVAAPFVLLALTSIIAASAPAGAPPVASRPGDAPIPAPDAAKAMTVPPGFKVTLFAAEPDVVQPIAFTFDDRGRMWVIECVTYPNWVRDGKGKDRVIILEDTDGNGTHDKKTVFMDNGGNLSGIELGFGGVWLCSSPNLVFVPILDGDRPGKPEVKLDGWNMTDTKHNIFNSLVWGPEGWLYGCNGIQAKAWVGAPGTPKEKRPYMDCGVWRYHPTRKIFEPVAHGTTNPFGLDFDEHGELFITNCVIDHLFHFVPGGHYERMYGQDVNPYSYGLMKSCVDYRHWGSGPWTDSRANKDGTLRKEHDDAGGGHAHSGCAIYLGDNFPKEYRNTLFTANIHGSRLNNDGLVRTPSGMKGVRRPDFLFANDPWFRGICVKCGPDGALYFSDWCDTGECHNYDKADTTNGRIYRVSYGDPKPFKGDVSTMTDAELVKLQLSQNEWLVRMARRVLQERAEAKKLDKETPDALRAILKDHPDATRRLRALWALHATGRVSETDLVNSLKDGRDESMRVWGIRLFVDYRLATPSPLDEGAWRRIKFDIHIPATDEKSEFVLLAYAGVIQRLPTEECLSLALNLARRNLDPGGGNLTLMIWYAIQKGLPGPDIDMGGVIAVAGNASSPVIRRNAVRYAISSSTEKDRRRRLDRIFEQMKSTTGGDEWHATALAGLQEAFAGVREMPELTSWAALYPALSKSGSTEVRARAEALAVFFGTEQVLADLAARVRNPMANPKARAAAIELLLTRKQPEFRKTLVGLLDDPAVRQVAIRGLAAFPDTDTPAAILKVYPRLTLDEKADAVNTLAARKEWANALLDAVEKKELPRADVSLTTARQILAINDKTLSVRLETVWGKIGSASKERVALTKKWKETLTEPVLAKADPAAGRALFTKHCGACHKMFGEGQTVGPELTGSQRANLDYVLENVLDPSAVVPNEFRMVHFTTKDERVVSGIVLRETKDAVTIRTANEQMILPTADIAARKPTNLSIMPDGLFDQLKPDEVRDLVAYLRTKVQVPLPVK